MLKFKVGDKIKISAGKDKGREGEIERIFPARAVAIIPGVNIYKKHVKGMPERKGGVYEVPRPVSFSKFSLICPKCKKLVRVGFKAVDGRKVRICKKCGREVDTEKGTKKVQKS